MSRLLNPLRPFAFFILLVALPACTTVNPATGERDFTPFMSPAQEQALGAQEHPKVMEQFGGPYDHPGLQDYVDSVGQSLAAVSELKDQKFTFTVLNSPIPNAFALPGGYVYITRGLLAIISDEAEMAGVLGHEIGHVTARHSAKRYNNAVFSQILVAGVGVAAGNDLLTNVAQLGAGAFLAKYSRSQELQSDSLGIRYLLRADYDPWAQGDMLGALDKESRMRAQVAGKDISDGLNIFATHPLTPDRVVKADAIAAESGHADGALTRNAGRYLNAIDGMYYGDDPRQGLIRGKVFWHGPLGFTFTVPNTFSLVNTDSAVLAQSEDGKAAMSFSGGKIDSRDSLEGLLRNDWGKGLTLSNVQSFKISGLDAITGVARVTSNNQSVHLRLVGIRMAADRVYRFDLYATPSAANTYDEPMLQAAMSFRRLATNEVNTYRAHRIKVVTVQRTDTAESLARLLPFDKLQLERLLALNNLDSADQIKPGMRLKLVVEE